MHILLLIAFFKDPLKCFRNSGTYLVGNLAISDLLVCLLAILRSAIATSENDTLSRHPFGNFLWVYLPAVTYTSIVAISIDRFFMVAYPLQHRTGTKGKVLAAWLASIWLVSFIYPTKVLAFGEDENDSLVANIFGLAGTLFSAVMYALTYFKMRKQSGSIALDESSGTNSRTQIARILKEKRFLTTIIVIACINVVCNLPVFLFFKIVSVQRLLKNSLASKLIKIIFSSSYYFNYTVNPFIYITRLPNYRKTFYLLYCKNMASCCKRK